MTSRERWLKVRELFEGALDQDPDLMHDWLRQQVGSDSGLHEEVAALLAHHSKAGSFLNQPALQQAASGDGGVGLEPGQVIGPYQITRELGRGGMGRVYLATDQRLRRPVALKAIAPALLGSDTNRERLRREARAAASLAHPGICAVYALEEIDGELFIAAEFVEGETLREESQHSSLPSPGDVLRTARELAEALAHAHAKGLVHRDLKPENVMRTRGGGLKILDFGLARAQSIVEGESRMTQTGAIVGTPAYMAPEQLNGHPVTAAADVFALGVLLYEYASRTHPFGGNGPLATAARILESDHVPLAERRPDLPPALLHAVERCLRKAPGERFATASEVAAILNQPMVTRSRSRSPQWWRTHQITVLALYLGACGLMWQVKEWLPGIPTTLFLGAGILATVAGVFRSHLLFVEWSQGGHFAAERRRAAPVTMATDVLLGAALAVDGLILADLRPVPAVLSIALGIGIVLTRVLIEPSTTSASFTR